MSSALYIISAQHRHKSSEEGIKLMPAVDTGSAIMAAPMVVLAISKLDPMSLLVFMLAGPDIAIKRLW